MKKYKGSLLFDVILGLAAVLFVVSLMMPTLRHEQYVKAVHEFIERVDLIIQKTILDPYKGYVSVNNAFCAPDYINSFKDITAYRVVKCANVENNLYYYYDNTDPLNENNATKSFVYDMNEWIHKDSLKNYGCTYYISQGVDTSHFNMFFDCSALREPGMIDSEMLVFFKKKYPVQLIGWDLNALSIDSSYVPLPGETPSETDGKILLKFQK